MTEEKGIKVRDRKVEIVVKDGDKEFRYGKDAEGKLQIIEAKGLKTPESASLMDRLFSAAPNNCPHCLEVQLNSDLSRLLLFSLLEEEDDMFSLFGVF